MKKTTTKRAMLGSAISLLLCFAMLIGTTFAWFTDNVTSTNNIIKSGNLDVELYYMNSETTDWTKVDGNTNVFKKDTLWEPGHAEVVKLKVVNEGSLALKYQLGVNVASEQESVNVNDDKLRLSDYIKYGVVAGDQTYTREEAVTAVDATANALKVAYTSDSTELLPLSSTNTDNEDIVTMVVYMPTSVGNEANYAKGENAPVINLGINLYATQKDYEEDSFGKDYDENAKYDKPIKVTSAAELLDVLENTTEKVVIDATGVTIEITEEIAGGTAAAYELPAGVTIKGATFVPTHRGGNYILMSAGANEQVVFENCNFDNAGNSLVIGSTVDGPDSVIYNNCTFTGQVITNFVDNPVGVADFNGCIFTKATSGVPMKNFVEGMGGTHNFNNCTFDYTGVTQSSMGVVTSGCINVYSEAGYSTTIVLNGCTRTNCGTRTYGPNSTLTIK